MRIQRFALTAMLFLFTGLHAQDKSVWRAATQVELEAVLPSRASVQNEHIETELRTATGIRDDRNHTIAAVVLITAGYAAEGKYSHFLLVQSPFRVGDVLLTPGKYVLGWRRDSDGLSVHLFSAETGEELGTASAHPSKQPVRVEPFHIWPPGEHKGIQIGRFFLPYSLEP